MRIISGKFKGRIIPVSPKLKARPTTDKAKEALFNRLNFEIEYESLSVLDLFSGTGNISLEFASRGVEDITAVDIRHEHVKFINSTFKQLGINGIVLQTDVFKFLSRPKKSYHLVFADPPYDMENFDELVELTLSGELLKDKGLFILEHGPGKDFSKHKNFADVRSYGKVHFTRFEK
ncbi:MAG: RsmD family RNA methyltransferase [Bacteroidales bacterium]|nr:RsmD family RNA methyltransferase [Bacteroidales bacterium]